MNESRLEMIEAMKRFGGSFVKALAECLLLADELNFQKLCEAFPEYVELYCEEKWQKALNHDDA